MDGIISGLNEEIEKQGMIFAEQSKLAVGDVSSFIKAVRIEARFLSLLSVSNLLIPRLIGQSVGYKDFSHITSYSSSSSFYSVRTPLFNLR